MSELIGFATPTLALAVLPLLMLMLWQLYRARDRGSLKLTGLEYLGATWRNEGHARKYFQLAGRIVLISGLAVVLAGPRYRSEQPLFDGDTRLSYRNFLIAFDMSPSMNLPASFKGYGGEDLKEGEEGVTRYEMAREALFQFMDRFQGERFGLILFSTEPFFARWPTTETGNRFAEVLESIRRGAGTQLEAFSSLTNIDKGLLMAQQAFAGEEGAIILISDAEDDLENLGRGVRSLRRAGIRLYTLGVGIPDTTLENISREFADDPGFRIFRADSAAEMEQAYQLVSEIEESPLFSDRGRVYETDLRGPLSILLALVSIVLLVLNERLFHQTLGPGRERGNFLQVSDGI